MHCNIVRDVNREIILANRAMAGAVQYCRDILTGTRPGVGAAGMFNRHRMIMRMMPDNMN